MLSFIRGEESSLDLARELVARAKGNAMPPRPAIGNSWWYDLADVTVLAPIPRPLKNVFCLGRNYREHAAEGARARGEAVVYPPDPVFFTKPPTAVVGPDAPITFQRTVTSQVDYEVELGVVIGKTGANIPRQDAWDHVFGYTIVNDVSARDLQTRHNQWFKGKGLDTFCPMGPYLVSRDELPEVKSLELRLRVNGELRQQARIDEMIFDISAIIEILSAGLTLEPGDVIATGTPQGVGFAMIPPRFLCAGDLVECEIEGIGILRNPVRER
ncbi:MAG: fumarylacetoacetate hydrolase family protein [Chloroflexi bacterium]|nr:fumarylacetoacetate hydrolase family protein [Chloroflexota bacterium]